MPTTDAASEYATLIIQTRIEALRALAAILATSEDPTEKRLAAVAILRAPNPDSPARATSETPARTRAEQNTEGETRQAWAHAAAHLAHQLDPQGLSESLRTATRLLTAAGVPLHDATACAHLIADFENGRRAKSISPSAHLAATAGQAPPS
jgi:hypothetical protein